MGALATQHEKTRAVSNVPVNARGDIIDNRGNVTVQREKISKEYYKDNSPRSIQGRNPTQEERNPKSKKAPRKNKNPRSKQRDVKDDGTMYYEVEYDDGSMEEINVEVKALANKVWRLWLTDQMDLEKQKVEL